MPDKNNNFVHLHVHTQYSLLDGAIRIGPLFQRANQEEMTSVAITDHGTMFGVLEFYEEALKANVKPIIGCECYLAPRTIHDRTAFDSKGLSHLVLLAENMEGYRNLCKLATIAQVEGFYYKPRIDKEVLQEHGKGIIALSACLNGEIPRLIKSGKMDEADDAARFYQNVFGEDNFFLEVQHNGIEIQEKVNQALNDMSQRLSIPMVATNDCHYLDRDDVEAHDLLLCIQTGRTVNETGRFRFNTDQLYFKTAKDMEETLGQYPGAIENTAMIAERCHVEFDFNNYHFPQFTSGMELTADELFEKQVREGYSKRIAKLKKKKNIDQEVYDKRLDYEVGVIKDMGFPGYFLIVADFIRYSKENNVPVGPGRGSAAGSIVAYSMGITELDPIEHGLIFERFLNPSRISMPDIDVDFCINGREKTFKYVVERYGGGDYVAQIITFGKLKTRAVIRDVGRALDIPLKEVDAIAKMIPDEIGISLGDSLNKEPRLPELAKEKPEIAKLFKICKVLEGLPRHSSTHAAGVVIGDKPLVEYLPLYKGKKGEVVTQFDMKRVEKIGLVKFDFLGLRNLTVIEETLTLLKYQGKEVPDLLENLDFCDQDTYRLLCKGDTTGVFQLESSGMKELLVRLRPETFADVTALVALYRPGPLDSGMVTDYVERKHGRAPVEYLSPELEPILKETYGVILYQEQVMKIAAVLAGYSMAEADGLRKAMGKKLASMMAKHREMFMQGTRKNNIPGETAKKIFDLMEKFGGYGFNKSHSAAYALIAYQTAYLKAHFPVELMAALLTSEMHNTDAVVKYIEECRSHGIEILPPDINESDKTFKVNEGKIRFGLVAVKNVGDGAIDIIMEERRSKGKYKNLFDFCERVDLRKVNKRVLESLIKCGAFDSTGHNRAQMAATLEDALEFGQKIQKEKADPQMSLFAMEGEKHLAINAPPMVQVGEWDKKELLKLEKETLGFYVSGHPLDVFRRVLDKFTTSNALTIGEEKDGAAARIGGTIKSIKDILTRKSEKMAFVTLEDINGLIESVVFPKVYEEFKDLLALDEPVLIQGKIQKKEKTVQILAESIAPLDKAEETWTASIHITLDSAKIKRGQLEELRGVFRENSGNCPLYMHVVVPEESETILALSEKFNLNPSPSLMREIDAFLGYKAVETKCKKAVVKDRPARFTKKWNNG